MEQVFNLVNDTLGGPLGTVLGAIFIFIIGYFVAKIIAGIARKLFGKVELNKRLGSATGKSVDAEGIGATVVFALLMAMVLAAIVSMLNITAVSEPLAGMIHQVLSFIPLLITVAILAVVGWVLATFARSFIQTGLAKTSLDGKINEKAGIESIGSKLANVAYWLIAIIFLVMIVNKLDLGGPFAPLTNMFDIMFASLTNIVAAAIIFAVGYIIAKIARSFVGNLVASFNLQECAEKVGLTSENKDALPKLAGSLVFLLIIIPTTISALQALKIDAISRPATNMLNVIMEAIPSIIAAIAVVTITYFVMRMVVGIIKNVLENTAINQLPTKLGFAETLGETKASDLVGSLIMFFAMLFAIIMAANILGFTMISEIVAEFIAFGGSIFKGMVILFIGFWLANLVSGIIARSEQGSQFLANLARVLIIGLVLAMGLRSMGIADSIVNLAFGLTLGSVAVAFALSFGLGGQAAAARFLKDLQDKQDENR